MNQDAIKEFESFLREGKEPPRELDASLFSEIRRRLNPSVPLSVSKLLALNLVGSVATLFLCPQYGLALTGSMGVMHYLMSIHPALCFSVCGLLWMLGGQLLAHFILSWDEQRVLSRHYWGVGFSFILFSVLGFACLGSLTLDLWLGFWALGAFAVISAFGLRIRVRVRRFESAVLLNSITGR